MTRTRALVRVGACVLCSLGPSVEFAAGQVAPDTFVDPVARTLFEAAQTNWRSVDASVVRYTALIKQRISAAIRTPLKDRIIYRNETAVRAFWDQDHDAVVQVLGTHLQYPGRSIAVREGDMGWLEDLPFDKPFEPGGERLLLGISDEDDSAFESNEEDGYWVEEFRSASATPGHLPRAHHHRPPGRISGVWQLGARTPLRTGRGRVLPGFGRRLHVASPGRCPRVLRVQGLCGASGVSLLLDRLRAIPRA